MAREPCVMNTDFNHWRAVDTAGNADFLRDWTHLVSVPDGLAEAMYRVMPRKLEELVEEINRKGDDGKITCLLADVTMS